jgi:hypothetical protein
MDIVMKFDPPVSVSFRHDESKILIIWSNFSHTQLFKTQYLWNCLRQEEQ